MHEIKNSRCLRHLLLAILGGVAESRGGKLRGREEGWSRKHSGGGKLRRMSVALVALALAACLFACKQTDQKSAGPLEKVAISYSNPPYTALIDIAQARGFFRQEGLEATLQVVGHGGHALNTLHQGKADFATAGETPIMLAIMKGEEISIISTIQTSNKSNAIVARKDKGILTPGDLKGRKIAVTHGTVREFFMDAFLAVNGISRKDVKVVDLEPAKMADALAKGQVDAVSSLYPDLVRIQKKMGDKGTTFYDENIYTQTFNVVATQEYVRRNSVTVKKVLRALLRAEEFVIQNPTGALKIVEDFRQVERGLLDDVWAVSAFNLRLDQSLVLALEDESRWAIKNRLTNAARVPNYLDFIYLDGLASVNPEAVRMLR